VSKISDRADWFGALNCWRNLAQHRNRTQALLLVFGNCLQPESFLFAAPVTVGFLIVVLVLLSADVPTGELSAIAEDVLVELYLTYINFGISDAVHELFPSLTPEQHQEHFYVSCLVHFNRNIHKEFRGLPLHAEAMRAIPYLTTQHEVLAQLNSLKTCGISKASGRFVKPECSITAFHSRFSPRC